MSERSEQMLILELLREGKITSEQAERLLRALAGERPGPGPGPRGPRPGGPRSGPFWWLERGGRAFEGVEEFGRELERTLRRFTEELKGIFQETRGTPPEAPESGAKEKSADQSYFLPEMEELLIEHGGGNLRVQVAPEESQLQFRASEPTVDFVYHAEAHRGEIHGERGHLTVLLPGTGPTTETLRKLQVAVAGGLLHGEGWRVREMDASVSAGTAKIVQVEGSLKLEVVGGTAHVERIQGPRLRVDVAGGSARVDRPEVARLEVEAAGGNVEVHGVGPNVREGGELRSSGGSVILAFSEQPHYEIQYSGLPEIPGSKVRCDWEKERIDSDRFRLGNGGPLFVLEAIGGSIHIARD